MGYGLYATFVIVQGLYRFCSPWIVQRVVPLLQPSACLLCLPDTHCIPFSFGKTSRLIYPAAGGAANEKENRR